MPYLGAEQGEASEKGVKEGHQPFSPAGVAILIDGGFAHELEVVGPELQIRQNPEHDHHVRQVRREAVDRTFPLGLGLGLGLGYVARQ